MPSTLQFTIDVQEHFPVHKNYNVQVLELLLSSVQYKI